MVMQAWKVFQKKKVGGLRDMLAAHSLDTSGTKSVLVARVAKKTSTDSNLETQPPTGICHSRWIGHEQ